MKFASLYINAQTCFLFNLFSAMGVLSGPEHKWLLSDGYLYGTVSQSLSQDLGQGFVCLLPLVHLVLCLFCSHSLSAGGYACG